VLHSGEAFENVSKSVKIIDESTADRKKKLQELCIYIIAFDIMNDIKQRYKSQTMWFLRLQIYPIIDVGANRSQGLRFLQLE
jgi:hypothetical protein